jgi:hypothetical protein
MILFIAVIVPLIIYCTWIFFKKSPAGRKSYILIYNLVTFSIILTLSAYFGFNVYSKVMDTVDSGWAPFIAFIYSTFSFVIGIFLAFLIRNFLIFRSNSKK